VNIPDTESVHSTFTYSRAPTAPGSSPRGDVGYSAASDIWADINQGEDGCLDQGVLQLGPNVDNADGYGGFRGCLVSELQFNLTGRTGSFMYMAPEMYKGLPYNEKVGRGEGSKSQHATLFSARQSGVPSDCSGRAA
jgi:hypothetical protein